MKNKRRTKIRKNQRLKAMKFNNKKYRRILTDLNKKEVKELKKLIKTKKFNDFWKSLSVKEKVCLFNAFVALDVLDIGI